MQASEYLVEVGAHNGTAAVTLRVSSGGYNTGPSDTPANANYPARIEDPGFFQRHLFGAGRTLGPSEVSYGEIRVVNVDGALDSWLDLGFDGRTVSVKRLSSRRAAYGTAETVLRATVDRLDSDNMWSGFRLRLYDRRRELDKPLQGNRYAGTTLATGPTAEGTADLKDQLKPLCFGNCFNVPAVPVNPFDLIYQVHDGAVASIAVFDGGVPLSAGGNHATIAALRSAAIRPGQYLTCLALGLFRLGAAPAYGITADVLEGATAALRRAGAVSTRMLAKLGLTGSANVNAATFTALDSAAPYEVGHFVADEQSALEALSIVLGSVGGWILPNNLGAFEVGRLATPGTPAATLTQRDLLGDGVGLVSNPDTDGGIPAWRIVLRYRPAFEVQDDSRLGGCVSVARRGAVAVAQREVRAENAGVKTKHMLAPELAIDTALANAADAQAEAARRLALYNVRRDVLTFPVAHRDATAAVLGSTVTVSLPRFGYQAGRRMVVIGRNENLRDERVELTLWG
jgi:hypothetical protein